MEEDEDYTQGGGGRTKRFCQVPSEHALDLRFSEFSKALPDEQFHFGRNISGCSSSSISCEEIPRSSLTSAHNCSYDRGEVLETEVSTRASRRSNSLDDVFHRTQSSEDILKGSLYRSQFERQVALKEYYERQNTKRYLSESSTYSDSKSYRLTSHQMPMNTVVNFEKSFDNQQSCLMEIDPGHTTTHATNLEDSLSQASCSIQENSIEILQDESLSLERSYNEHRESLISSSPFTLLNISPHSSPDTSPYSSPFHKATVDDSYRLLAVPVSSKMSPVNLSRKSTVINSDATMGFLNVKPDEQQYATEQFSGKNYHECSTTQPVASSVFSWLESPRETLNSTSATTDAGFVPVYSSPHAEFTPENRSTYAELINENRPTYADQINRLSYAELTPVNRSTYAERINRLSYAELTPVNRPTYADLTPINRPNFAEPINQSTCAELTPENHATNFRPNLKPLHIPPPCSESVDRSFTPHLTPSAEYVGDLRTPIIILTPPVRSSRPEVSWIRDPPHDVN